MRVLVLQHITCEPPGVFEDALDERSVEMHRVELDEGEQLPGWHEFDAIVAMGGPMSVNDDAELPWLDRFFAFSSPLERSRRAELYAPAIREEVELDSALEIFRAFGEEQHELETFRKLNVDYQQRNLELLRVSGVFHPSLAFLAGLTALLGLYLGGREVMAGRITLGERSFTGDPFAVLQRALAHHRLAHDPALPVPFQTGAIGWLGYGLCHHLERLPHPAADDLALPDLMLGFYDAVLAFDLAARRAWVMSSGWPG